MRPLLRVEHALDLLAAARRLVALAAALRGAAGFGEAFDGILDLRRLAAAEAAAAGIAAQRRRVDAAARRADARRDQRALGERRVAARGADGIGAIEPVVRDVVAQRLELLRERQQSGHARALARLLRPVDGRRLGRRASGSTTGSGSRSTTRSSTTGSGSGGLGSSRTTGGGGGGGVSRSSTKRTRRFGTSSTAASDRSAARASTAEQQARARAPRRASRARAS